LGSFEENRRGSFLGYFTKNIHGRLGESLTFGNVNWDRVVDDDDDDDNYKDDDNNDDDGDSDDGMMMMMM